MIRYSICLVLAFIIFGCSSDEYKTVNNQLYKYEYHLNGSIKARFQCQDTETLDGIAEFYSIEGNLFRKVNYRNNRLHGRDSGFYTSGRLQYIEYWEDSLQQGEGIHFYDSNPVKINLYISEDTVEIENRPISEYIYFEKGNVKYNRKYRMDQTVLEQSGRSFVRVDMDTTGFGSTSHINIIVKVVAPSLAQGAFYVNHIDGRIENIPFSIYEGVVHHSVHIDDFLSNSFFFSYEIISLTDQFYGIDTLKIPQNNVEELQSILSW